ncbi:hypothetical protein NG831_01640 [Xanthomonas sacchari]|uniref:hypothetical protein n=1 Tax=Xanthomonas sacchari TaxID=56458 RepID=UPI0022555BD4|nr:hypothetical protein [Xanthomonas sacchari]UYK66946.1 hypothetical protein NG831_01640 [Xanthomonas sacchari]
MKLISGPQMHRTRMDADGANVASIYCRYKEVCVNKLTRNGVCITYLVKYQAWGWRYVGPDMKCGKVLFVGRLENFCG